MKILIYPNKKLRQKTAKVRRFDNELKKTIDEMRQLLKNEPVGVGLAAPQVDILKQIIVIEYVPSEGDLMPAIPFTVLINPRITKLSKETEVGAEGCLSFPGQEFEVKRPKNCTILVQDLRGNRIRIRAKDILARICQHEIDHLSGVLVIDKQVKQSSTKSNKVKQDK